MEFILEDLKAEGSEEIFELEKPLMISINKSQSKWTFPVVYEKVGFVYFRIFSSQPLK